MAGRFKVLRYRLARVPIIALHVNGRKLFDKRYTPAIRAMWKVGDYGK
ncbi:hypothetical protein [Rhizobium sp. rho-13.1]|nr:hypothetical protein [Rhizobium sp. rho-13.1]